MYLHDIKLSSQAESEQQDCIKRDRPFFFPTASFPEMAVRSFFLSLLPDLPDVARLSEDVHEAARETIQL